MTQQQSSSSVSENFWLRTIPELDTPDLPDAECKDLDPEIWFGSHVCGPDCDGPRGCTLGKSETGRQARIELAKSICDVCVEKEKCLDWAVKTRQQYGVWGGKSENERRTMYDKRKKVKGG